MQSAVLSLVVVALLISAAAAQCSASSCESCFNAGCSWAPITFNGNQASTNGACYAQGQVPANSIAYASFVVSVQYCGLASCVANLAASLINNGAATGQAACNAYSTYFTCVTNNFCNAAGSAVCTAAFRDTYCRAYWSALSCSGTCPFTGSNSGSTTSTVPAPTATKSLPQDCFVTTLFNTFATWTWSASLSTNALTWYTNFRTCLALAATNYLQNTQQITCSNFQSALNDALRTCGSNANGASICGLSGAEVASFISTNPLGNNTQVSSTVRLALQNCPSTKYSEARFTFPNLSVSQLQALAGQIVARICTILNINPCNKVTFVAAVQAKRQASATAVVGISADQGQDANAQVATVVGQSQQVAQAAGTTTVAATTCTGQCSVSPATVATLAPVLLVALVVLVLVL